MSALRKVLVVDDDPVVARSFDRVLSGKGYAVITASSGQEALNKIENEEYDVVFTDIKMPGMSGLEMAEQVKQRRPWLPVVIVTGYGSPGNEARAEAAGVSSFLRKPLSPEMIEDSAEKAWSEKGTPAASHVAEAIEAAPASAPSAIQKVARFAKNVALFLASPFIGLLYILTFPIVGLGMLAWTAMQAQKKQSESVGEVKPVTSSPAKAAAMFVIGPLVALAFVVAGPIIGLGLLAFFALQAWGKMGSKSLAGDTDTK